MINHFIGKLFGRAVGCPCHEDLFDFALDGLDAKGKESVRKHLGDCPHCRDQVKDYAWVSEGIALTAPQIDPPVDMCDKVKARIRAEKEANPAPILNLGRDPLAGWPRFWMRLGPVFALASLMMTVLAFAAVFMRPVPQAQPVANAVMDSPSMMLVSLKGESGVKGSLFVAPGMSQAVLKVHGLKACQAGASYGLWACPKGGKPSLLGSFQAVDGRCSYVLSLPRPFESSGAPLDFEVTHEEKPGIEKGPIQLRGRYNL